MAFPKLTREDISKGARFQYTNGQLMDLLCRAWDEIKALERELTKLKAAK